VRGHRAQRRIEREREREGGRERKREGEIEKKASIEEISREISSFVCLTMRVGISVRGVFASSHTGRGRSCRVLAARPGQVSEDTTVRSILVSKSKTRPGQGIAPQGNIRHFYSCAPGDAVDSVLGSVKLKRQTGGLPVIDPSDERLVGFVSRSDLTNRDGAVVEDVMTGSPVSVADSDSALEALDIMRQFGVRSLPVLDGDLGRCVGLITMDDVAKTKATRGAGVGGDDVALMQLDKDSVDM
jgi:CBS domain-containing protein